MYKMILPTILMLSCQFSFSLTVDELETKAQQGDINSQFRLGLAYEKGTDNIYPDFQQAEFWYEMAYKKGDVKSAARLALMEKEAGNYALAKKYLKKGVEDKFPYSYYVLGSIMIEEENEQGYKLIEFAAKKGVPDALYDYAEYQAKNKKHYTAYIYAKLSAMKGKRPANDLVSIYGRELTPKKMVSANMKASKLYEQMKK